jgi:hypothetical protein
MVPEVTPKALAELAQESQFWRCCKRPCPPFPSIAKAVLALPRDAAPSQNLQTVRVEIASGAIAGPADQTTKKAWQAPQPVFA